VRNRGIRRSPAGRGSRHRGAAPPGVPRLRLRRDRAGARRPGGLGQAGGQARQPGEGDDRPPAAPGDHGHRPHPVGHPRRAQRRERPPAPGQHRPAGRRPQRHHRELRRPARRPRGRRARDALRDRHRGRRTPPRARGLRRRGPHHGDAERLPPPPRRLHPRRAGRRGPRPRGRRPPQLPARRGHRRGRELPRLRRRGVHRAHPRGAGARAGPGRDHHRRRRQRQRLRRHARRGPPLPRRLGPRRGREGRPRLVHAQGDPRAAARRGRVPAGPPQRRGPAAARRDAPLRRRPARHRQDHHHRGRHVLLRRHGRQVRHRALDPHLGRGRARQRVPLPRPDPDPLHPGGRDQPVGRDRRHPAGHPARAGAALAGAGDLQHQRVHDPARVRRGHLHPRRPGDRCGVHQGLPDPAGRLLPPRALPRPGQGHAVRRRDRAGHGPARPDAGPHPDRARRRRVDLRARPRARRRPLGAVPGPPRGLPRGPRGRAEAQGDRLPPRGGLRRRRAQARSHRAGRAGPARLLHRAAPGPRPAAREDGQRHPGGARPGRPHAVHRRGGRRVDPPVRRRARAGARRPRAPAAAGLGGPAPAVRLRAGHAARPRRRPAPQPGEIGHGRV
ncbi:MAG: Glutamine--fructose-6-phosphate aminotransferase [isomerizing], partial [uncultured Nocardioides sp.]